MKAGATDIALGVGCSRLIARGEIGLVQLDDVETFVAERARLRDGRVVPADLVVLATGYHGQEALLRRLFGEAVAARVGPVWGFDDEGELRAMWKRTGQPGHWFIAGSFAQCRIYSRPHALQIKACEEGIIPRLPHDGSCAEARRPGGRGWARYRVPIAMCASAPSP